MSSEQLAVKSSSSSLVDSALRDLESLYHADSRPWVVAFSGGKDSTVILQLVFNMLLALGKRATKKVFVLSSDTQVEAPNVAEYVVSALDRIQQAATDLDQRRDVERQRARHVAARAVLGDGRQLDDVDAARVREVCRARRSRGDQDAGVRQARAETFRQRHRAAQVTEPERVVTVQLDAGGPGGVSGGVRGGSHRFVP